jgi:hypothetical protein
MEVSGQLHALATLLSAAEPWYLLDRIIKECVEIGGKRIGG